MESDNINGYGPAWVVQNIQSEGALGDRRRSVHSFGCHKGLHLTSSEKTQDKQTGFYSLVILPYHETQLAPWSVNQLPTMTSGLQLRLENPAIQADRLLIDVKTSCEPED
jgi:hypothetical protein